MQFINIVGSNIQFGMMNGTGNYTGMMRGGYWFWDILGWIFVILVFIALILLIKYLWDRTFGETKRREESALEILQKKYVRGEISKEEFEEKKKDLI